MHEISLCESILDIIRDLAVRDDFTQVRRVCIEVGPFSSVEPEALRFGFDVVMRGSVAEGARLDIEIPEASALCLACLDTVTVRQRGDVCPTCGADALQIERGEELRIRELEVV